MNRLSFLAVLVLACGPLLVGCDIPGTQAESKTQAENARAWSELDRSDQLRNDELAAENMKIEANIVRLEFGDSASAQWVKCKTDPPKRVENQRACSALIARVDRRNAAELAAAKKKQASW